MPRRPRLEDFRATTPSPYGADELLREARRFLDRARGQIRGDHADSVAHSSRAIELSAKALLTLAGFSFPRRHDVGVGLARVWQALDGEDPGKVQRAKRHIARIGWLCDVVEPLQSISEYGYAEKRPSLIVNERDARVFYDYGRECLNILRRVNRRIGDRSFRLRPPEQHR